MLRRCQHRKQNEKDTRDRTAILWKVKGQGEGRRKEGGLVEEKRMTPLKP